MRFKWQQLAARVARKLTVLLPHSRFRAHTLQWIHLNLEDCEHELKHLFELLPPSLDRGIAIDIGANCGYYSIELGKYFDRVYAFEINPHHAAGLTMLGDNISVISTGLSSQKGRATLYIPVVGDLALEGWASLHEGHLPYADCHINVDVSIDTLDSYGFSDVGFIKIDVEGHEDKVLLGARDTLVKNSPLLLVEINEQNSQRVSSFLSSIGYMEIRPPCVSSPKRSSNHLFAKQP